MQVAEQAPETKIGNGRWGRAAGIIMGVILLAIAALYILALVQLTSTVMVLRVGMYTSACRLFFRTRNVAILVGLVYLGLNLLATQKRPVLFLRRFGLDVNSVVSRVIRKGLGRQFRFVTLDDGRFPAVDIPALERWTSRLGPPVIAVIVALGAVAARDRFAQQGSSNGAYAQTAAQMSALMGYWIAIFWMLLMLAWVHSLQMRRKSRYQIRNAGQLSAFLFDIRQLGAWRLRLSLLRPQAVVAKVSDPLWQQCVSGVAEQFGIVLIDVSALTANLEWEIEQSRRTGLECVFIAEKSRLESWMDAAHLPLLATAVGDTDPLVASPEAVTTANGGATTPAESILRLVGDDCVLLYQGDQRLGGAPFRRSLRQLLRKAGGRLPRRRWTTPFPLADRLWRISLAAIFHGFVLCVAMASGAFIGLMVFLGAAN